jgi:hypothetical protein
MTTQASAPLMAFYNQ